jgi:tRNA pseudouridine38-40 synthase
VPDSVAWPIALRIAYDGGRFASYARNPGTRSVESALLLALEGQGLVEGSFRSGSRTDAGVCAKENVVAATLDRPHLAGVLPALQARLPPGVWATGLAGVEPGWNPRHAAWRRYVLWHPANGEAAARMAEACAAFVGRHDMTAFARVEAGRDPAREVLAFGVRRRGRLWAFRVQGGAFLWGQVRRMVGAALAVGRGEASVADVRQALRTGRPHRRFATTAAEGLVLERVAYPGLRWQAQHGRAAAGLDVAALRARMEVAAHVAGLAGGPGRGTGAASRETGFALNGRAAGPSPRSR